MWLRIQLILIVSTVLTKKLSINDDYQQDQIPSACQPSNKHHIFLLSSTSIMYESNSNVVMSRTYVNRIRVYTNDKTSTWQDDGCLYGIETINMSICYWYQMHHGQTDASAYELDMLQVIIFCEWRVVNIVAFILEVKIIVAYFIYRCYEQSV